MTATTSPVDTASRHHTASRLRTVACGTAIAACIPYLSLKLAWICGSELGIPASSPLLDHAAVMRAVNGLTVLMDSAVVVLALMLSRPWGMRVPGWLPALPLWPATGLLAPIVVGWPAQLVADLVAGPVPPAGSSADFLEPWVFTVVYGGFLLQGLALGTLLARYVRDRWGHLLRGRLADLPRTSPTLPALRCTAVAAAVLGLLPLTLQVLWAAGGTAGLGPGAEGDFGRDFLLRQGGNALFTALAVAGVLLIAFRPVRRPIPLWAPVAAAWVGSGAMAGWGGWMLFGRLALNGGDGPPPAMVLVYAAQVIVGMLIASAGAHFFSERSSLAERNARTAP